MADCGERVMHATGCHSFSRWCAQGAQRSHSLRGLGAARPMAWPLSLTFQTVRRIALQPVHGSKRGPGNARGHL
jgi:hypothetical protein